MYEDNIPQLIYIYQTFESLLISHLNQFLKRRYLGSFRRLLIGLQQGTLNRNWKGKTYINCYKNLGLRSHILKTDFQDSYLRSSRK